MSDEGRRAPVSGPADRPDAETEAAIEALRRHLGSSLPEPPLGEVAWDELARSIAARAEPRLRLRRRPWWIHACRWSRVGIPVAAAAVLALALLVPGRRRAPTGPRPAAPGVPATGTREIAAATDPVLTFLSASDDGEALLLSALEEE